MARRWGVEIMEPFALSAFGQKFASHSGIVQLMEDLGRGLAGGGEVRMLGGGNPAVIPAVQEVWRRRMRELCDDPDALARTLGHYDPPRGNERFLAAVAGYLRRHAGWDVGPENLAVTCGGQSAFFCLFNLLAGSAAGRPRRIVLPLAPEYIGYADQGAVPGVFAAAAPRVELHGDHRFKYRIDFDALAPLLDGEAAAICVSRPTNPTANVLTDDEISRLRDLACARGIPLIVDNAYGAPFPGVLFRDVRPVWGPDMVTTLSLSKLGLPGVRTGIVVAEPRLAAAVASMTSILQLANTNLGQAILAPLLESDEIARLCRDTIRPFYAERRERALGWVSEFFDAVPGCRIHEPEGAFFLWFWFPGLPIPASELYARLKKRGVVVVPGEYFFFGGQEQAAHARECIRVSYAQREDAVREGLRIIADEVAQTYRGR